MTHEYKVGDMVRIVTDRYVEAIGMNAGTIHDVKTVTPNGVYVWSTVFDVGWFLLPGYIEPYAEPTPQRQLSPKEVMIAMSEFATDCGYTMTDIELKEIVNGRVITSRLDQPTHSQ